MDRKLHVRYGEVVPMAKLSIELLNEHEHMYPLSKGMHKYLLERIGLLGFVEDVGWCDDGPGSEEQWLEVSVNLEMTSVSEARTAVHEVICKVLFWKETREWE